ncbi:MAG: hypothetical protein FWF00_01215 [Endomicrobia bacterium]|nr:hypothetical protein [Endomicrobiia bacterium]MCL2506294.1 hypothetical protein [Endomicrobiia bacterium]
MEFEKFFAIDKKDIKETCVICQSFDLGLFSQDSNNGFFVKTAQTENATIIALKNNFLAGDTVLYLKDTKCKRIILFGSCGGCGDVESGDLLIIDKAYNLESFSSMLFLENNVSYKTFSEELSASFYAKYPYEDLIKTNSACVSSILLESDWINFFKANGICAVDMESSIVLSAAEKIEAQSLCLMYVADHIEKSPVGSELNEQVKSKISTARKNLAKMILDFTDAK